MFIKHISNYRQQFENIADNLKKSKCEKMSK